MLMSSASPLPCLTLASALCALALWQRGYIAEETLYGFVWRVYNERGVMTLHIRQMVFFSLDPSVMFVLFFFPPSAWLGLLREKWHVGTYVLVHTILV